MELLTTERAADYLGCHPVTLRRKAREGAVPYSRPFGGKRTRLYFDKAALDRWLVNTRHGPDVYPSADED